MNAKYRKLFDRVERIKSGGADPAMEIPLFTNHLTDLYRILDKVIGREPTSQEKIRAEAVRLQQEHGSFAAYQERIPQCKMSPELKARLDAVYRPEVASHG